MWQSRQFEIFTSPLERKVAGQLEVQLVEGIAWPTAPDVLARAVQAAVPHVVQLHTMPVPWVLSIRVGDAAEGSRLNRDFRQRDYVPDVLSFPSDDDDAQTDGAEDYYLGDVFITAEKTRADAAAQAKPADEHLAHLAVHGLLHLCGHDHEDGPAAEAAMQALEIKILAALQIANPYEGDPVG